jgi:hypothetical protein
VFLLDQMAVYLLDAQSQSKDPVEKTVLERFFSYKVLLELFFISKLGVHRKFLLVVLTWRALFEMAAAFPHFL